MGSGIIDVQGGRETLLWRNTERVNPAAGTLQRGAAVFVIADAAAVDANNISSICVRPSICLRDDIDGVHRLYRAIIAAKHQPVHTIMPCVPEIRVKPSFQRVIAQGCTHQQSSSRRGFNPFERRRSALEQQSCG